MKTLDTKVETEYLMLLVIIMVVSLLICVLGVVFFKPFLDERRFYKLEISRTSGEERAFWERELKYFYIRSLPFIGKIIYRKLRKRKNR